jgi:acyl carrier protein
MSDEEFLVQFVESIGAAPGSVQLDTPLRSIEVWDSVAYLNVMALVDERLGVVLDPESLIAAETPRSILEQARKGVEP